jgi:two-component system response regulator
LRKPEILLVEDDPNDEALTRMALEDNHIHGRLVVVRDGAEALDYLFARGAYADRDSAALPQVVILDLKLPKVTGIQVLQELRGNEKTALLPVVIFTSSNEDRDLIESYRHNANAFVRKPIEFKEFSEAVRKLGLFWLVLNIPAP